MDNTIHHAKDNKGTGSTPLCHVSGFDVYTMLHHVRGSPTEFVFALRAQDKPHIFERPEDFMYLLAAADYDALRQWVLSIRCAKVKKNQVLLIILDYGEKEMIYMFFFLSRILFVYFGWTIILITIYKEYVSLSIISSSGCKSTRTY